MNARNLCVFSSDGVFGNDSVVQVRHSFSRIGGVVSGGQWLERAHQV
jgi:hypothetical protein